jgi:hypothetical protein
MTGEGWGYDCDSVTGMGVTVRLLDITSTRIRQCEYCTRVLHKYSYVVGRLIRVTRSGPGTGSTVEVAVVRPSLWLRGRSGQVPSSS